MWGRGKRGGMSFEKFPGQILSKLLVKSKHLKRLILSHIYIFNKFPLFNPPLIPDKYVILILPVINKPFNIFVYHTGKDFWLLRCLEVNWRKLSS